MSKQISASQVIPFFKIQDSNLSLIPEEKTPTEKVWLEKEKLMMAILDSINDGVLTIDFNMKITSFNRAAEKITGYTAQEAIGKNCMDVFCNVGGAKEDCLENCPMKKTMKYKTPITKKRRIFNKKGEILTVSAKTNLLMDLNDNPIGGVEVFSDLTAFEQLKEKWQGKKYNLGDIIGKSPKMREIYQLIESISGALSSVLIQGDTGTGKGMIASAVHYHSINHKGPFVQVNCAAIPENLLEGLLFGTAKGAFTGAVNKPGIFEQAQGGTLFLDEVDSMPLNLQTKLLRFLQERKIRRVGGSTDIKIDVKIISSVSNNPQQALQDGQIRMDLFYRLAVVFIPIPPLRELLNGVETLTRHFIYKYNLVLGKSVIGVSEKVLDIFRRYHWPGNVRELEHLIEGTMNVIESQDIIRIRHLPRHFLPPEFTVLTNQESGHGAGDR